MQRQVNLLEIIRILELPQNTLSFFKTAKSFEEATQGLKEFKRLVNKQKRNLAKKYHPDLKHGDTNKMQQINNTVDFINKIKLMPPQPVMQTIVIRTNWASYSSTSSTTSTNYY